MEFEQAIKELEEIIKKLEDEQTTLDQGIQLFEKANELIKLCEKKLKDAKVKIAVLKGDEDENI